MVSFPLLSENFYSKESKWNEGQINEKTGNYKAAIKCYNEAYNLNPENLLAFLGLIRLKIQTQEFKDCESLLNKGLKSAIHIYGKETHPEVVKFKYFLAKFYFNQEHYDKARELYLEVIEIVDKDDNHDLVKNTLTDLSLVFVK